MREFFRARIWQDGGLCILPQKRRIGVKLAANVFSPGEPSLRQFRITCHRQKICWDEPLEGLPWGAVTPYFGGVRKELGSAHLRRREAPNKCYELEVITICFRHYL